MKRFKVFKILYYSFMAVIGIIFCFVLPSYNQLNTMTKNLKSDIKKENYSALPGYFGAVYNENAIINVKNDKGATMVIFESVSYMRVDQNESYSYADMIYMGFVINPVDYKYENSVDSSGNSYNYRGIKINDKSDIIEIPDTSYFYLTDLNFFYFEISKNDLDARNIDKINSIDILANTSDYSKKEGISYISANNVNLDFNNSSFYNVSKGYMDLVNESIYHNELTLSGNISYKDSGSTFMANSTIKYMPYGSPVLKLECDNINDLVFENATKNDDNTYKLQSNKELVIKIKSDTVIKGVTFIYDEISVRYGFDSSSETYSEVLPDNTLVHYGIKEDVTNSKVLGIKYEVEDVNERYSAWKEEYEKHSNDGYKLADVSGIITKARILTVVQVVCYFLVIFVIGDFLVGKRRIMSLCSRLFGKNNKKNKSEDVVINNDYEVNVVCSANVPFGYKDKISVVYGKENGEKMLFELDYSHNYKMAKRYKNGEYEFLALNANGLHLIKTNKKINVRGYRFELVLSLAYDEVNPEAQEAISSPETNDTSSNDDTLVSENKE